MPTRASDMKLTSSAFGADNFLRLSKSAMLRGGSATRFNGTTSSFSPELGLFHTLPSTGAIGGQGSTTLSLACRLLLWSAALLALIVTNSPAFAQAQVEYAKVTPGDFVWGPNVVAEFQRSDLDFLEFEAGEFDFTENESWTVNDGVRMGGGGGTQGTSQKAATH